MKISPWKFDCTLLSDSGWREDSWWLEVQWFIQSS